jgi:hypothetical protein
MGQLSIIGRYHTKSITLLSLLMAHLGHAFGELHDEGNHGRQAFFGKYLFLWFKDNNNE